MGAGLIEDELHGSAERHKRAANCVVAALPAVFCLACLLLMLCDFFYDFSPPEYWVKVAGVEGLDRSTGAATAPAFNITLRVNYDLLGNHRFGPLCGKGGSAVVAYAGVPLARGDFPELCVPAGVVGSVPVVATSEGLGLPDELYERMETQRRRHERVALAVHVRIDGLTSGRGSASPTGPFICPVLKYSLRSRIYDV